MMNKFFKTTVAFGLAAVVIFSGCTSTETALPALTSTSVPATVTPRPAFTPTPALFLPPADRFIPEEGEVGQIYAAESSLLSENLAAQASLPVPPENLAVASFRNRGGTRATDPQDGNYYRLTWWVVLAESEANARFLYGVSQNPDYAKSTFLLVMPAAIQEQMGATSSITMGKSRCEDVVVSAYVSDTYAGFRQGGVLPTANPMMAEIGDEISAEEMAKLPPDLFLYAACRVENAVILFWGHAPHNYDGKNSPIPEDVIAGQVQEKFDLVIDKLAGK